MRLYQTEKLLQSKGENINKMKRQPIKWKKVLANHTSEKGLICKIHKEFLLNRKNSGLKNGKRI